MLHALLGALAGDSGMAAVFADPLFRAGCATLTALALCLGFGPLCVRKLRILQSGQNTVRDDVPAPHAAKVGTPTAGGVFLVPALSLSSLLWVDLTDIRVLILMAVALAYSAIGLADDLGKLRGDSRGLSKKVRLAFGCLVAFPAVWGLTEFAQPDGAIAGDDPRLILTSLAVPYIPGLAINLGLFFLPFAAVLVVMGSANAVNITDGLDGLATGAVAMAAAAFGLIALLAADPVHTGELWITLLANAGEIAVFCGAMVGACLGFLWFNAPPAQIFMGDTGSLALGASLGAIAVAVKQELLLVVIGGLFVVVMASSFLQIISINWFDRRIFAKAPLHHHFEERGWPETRVLVRFWIVAALLALIGLTSLATG